jgi:acyl-CoA dehydrogenase
MPVAITVEGSNTLTRSLIVFGQGLNRAHPNMQDLISSIQAGNDSSGFHRHLFKLLGHAGTNAGRSFTRALTRSRMKNSGSLISYYESQLERLASAFAFSADLGMTLGGKLKVAECLSGRYADVLSEIYMGYSMLWFRRKNDCKDIDIVLEYAMDSCLHRIENAFYGIISNFPIRPVAWAIRAVAFPTGRCYEAPNDALMKKTSQLITTNTEVRSLLTNTVFVSQLDKTDRVREIETAFPICIEADKILSVMRKSKRKEPTEQERQVLERAEELRERIIQVDAFEQLVHPHEELVRSTSPDEIENLRQQGLQRQTSFSKHMADVEPESRSVRESGAEGHNDPLANRGKDMNTGLGW